ncbi:hypothetical protein CEJ45_11215 [Herbaspirillum aquaticum]|uniref:Tyrosine specific protein phosphatases domain-containing protein n=2 Tax=Herbaspirillum aquaticum TaxID=568783 RepID=A0A225SUG4_9BURK|nr:hypothetical protein CEJ45_11215 [Herbaspirillum aquaticum]
MPLSSREIYGRLLSPPISGRQVIAMSRGDAQQLPTLPGVAVISITAPEKPPAALAEFTHILRLSFADVDFLSKEISSRAAKKLQDAFTRHQASEVKQFVESLPLDIATIVVHCEGGFSRSCANAVALNKLYGYEVIQEQLHRANPSVVTTMLSVEPKKKK